MSKKPVNTALLRDPWKARGDGSMGATTRRFDNIDELPMYASRNEWAKFLGIAYTTIAQAYGQGKLEGEVMGNRISHTRRQILAWRAPALLKDLDAKLVPRD